MSWRKISMKFQGTCIECNEKIEVNEIGMWAKGIGVKHEKCAEVNDLRCSVCGGKSGCPQCEYALDCNLEQVSQLCICKKCLASPDAYLSYQKSVKKSFSLINI